MLAALPEPLLNAFIVFGGVASFGASWAFLTGRFERSVGVIVETKLDDKLQKVTDHIIEQFRAEIHLSEERFTVQIKQINIEILDLRARVVALENVNSKKEKK